MASKEGLAEYLALLDTPQNCTVEAVQAIMAAYPDWKPLETTDDNNATAVHHTVGVSLDSVDASAGSMMVELSLLTVLGFFLSLSKEGEDAEKSVANLDRVLAQRDVDGESILHYAARGGLPMITTELLPLLGRFNNTTDEAKILENQLTAINAEDGNGATPFHFAAQGGFMELLKMFMSLFAMLGKDKSDSPCLRRDKGGMSSLHYACSKGHLEAAQYLISQGCDPSVYDNDGTTALHYAAVGGDIELVEYLINNTVELSKPSTLVDSLGQTPLHFAAMGSHQKILEFLVSTHKCDPKAQTSVDGLTALHVAASNGDEAMMAYLTEKCGCDPTVVNAEGLTAADLLASSNDEGCSGEGCDDDGHHH